MTFWNIDSGTGTTIVDSWEDGDITEYSGDTANFSVVDASLEEPGENMDGSNSLKVDSSVTAELYSTSGLANYPSKGTISVVYLFLGSGIIADAARLWFGVSDASNYYMVNINVNNGNHALFSNVAGNFSNLSGNVTTAPKVGEWTKWEIIWDDGTLGGSDNDITVNGYNDSNSDGTFDNNYVTMTANNSDHAASSGIGYRHHSDPADNVWIDYWHIQ